MSVRRRAGRNRMLAGLPARESNSLSGLLETVDLAYGQVLCEPGEKIRHALFPVAGIVSLLAPGDGDAVLEVGLVGHEGMFGVPLAVGIAVSPVRAVVQGNGSALRLTAAQFRRVLKECPVLQQRLHRHTYSLMRQITQTAVCNNFHAVEARTARWMLSTSDRMQSDGFTLTQAFLADMLGVQRVAVSRAASALQAAELIDYSRGHVSILDRPGLEATSCSCYRISNRLYLASLR